MRPAAPVKMTSGMNVRTSIFLGLSATPCRAPVRAGLTAAASARKYLEPFQILASSDVDARLRVAAAGTF
jgi:hypothetical protein